MKVSFDEKHIKWGLTAFLVVLCSIIVFFCNIQNRQRK